MCRFCSCINQRLPLNVGVVEKKKKERVRSNSTAIRLPQEEILRPTSTVSHISPYDHEGGLLLASLSAAVQSGEGEGEGGLVHY